MRNYTVGSLIFLFQNAIKCELRHRPLVKEAIDWLRESSMWILISSDIKLVIIHAQI
jgi:hypothetical protein